MKIDNLPANHVTKKIVRQEEAYEAAGEDGERTLPLPFVLDADLSIDDQIANLGFDRTGVIRGLNQLFVENIGNLYAARVKSAITKKTALPTQATMDEMVANYDFSGVRASSEAGMSREERTFRTELAKQLRNVLRAGVFSTDGSAMTVQTKAEAAVEDLPDGKMALEDFENLVECAAEGVVFEYNEKAFDFSGEPVFDEDGNFGNFAAIVAWAKQLADETMAIRRRAAGRKIVS